MWNSDSYKHIHHLQITADPANLTKPVASAPSIVDATCIAGELWKLRSHYKEYDFSTSETLSRSEC